MLAASRAQRHAVVIGGGLLGLEAASGLLRRGLDVTVVHIHRHLMEQQLDAQAAELLRDELERRGLKFVMAAELRAYPGRLDVTGVGFADGSELAGRSRGDGRRGATEYRACQRSGPAMRPRPAWSTIRC